MTIGALVAIHNFIKNKPTTKTADRTGDLTQGFLSATATQMLFEKRPNTPADQKLYKLSRPMKYGGYNGEFYETEYVVVSAIVAMDTQLPETFIFPATETGRILSYLDLPGSFRGELNHRKALENAGYVVI